MSQRPPFLSLARGVVAEQVGPQWLVLGAPHGVVHRLDGPASRVMDAVMASEAIPHGHDEVIAGLITAGILTADPAFSRRHVLAAGTALTGIGIASVLLPTAAAAASTVTPDAAGLLWGTTLGAGTSSSWRSVATDGSGTWVAVAFNNVPRVMRSTDNGLNWAEGTVTELNSWTSVAYGDGVWIAVSQSGVNRVMRSVDGGITWSAVAAGAASSWSSVAYGNGVWVAVAFGGTSRIMRSDDKGVTWTAAVAPEQNDWYSVAYGDGVWVAVADNGTNRVMRSVDDGLTWLLVDVGSSDRWRAVAHGDDVWVAVGPNSIGGPGRIMRSTDEGASWVAFDSPADRAWGSVATNGSGQWVAVSAGNTVMVSPPPPE